MNLLDLLLLALATWRLAFFLSRENGPFKLMEKVRTRLGGALTCLYCSSVWSAVLWLVVWTTPAAPLAYIAAISGAALMLGSYTGANHAQG